MPRPLVSFLLVVGLGGCAGETTPPVTTGEPITEPTTPSADTATAPETGWEPDSVYPFAEFAVDPKAATLRSFFVGANEFDGSVQFILFDEEKFCVVLIPLVDPQTIDLAPWAFGDTTVEPAEAMTHVGFGVPEGIPAELFGDCKELTGAWADPEAVVRNWYWGFGIGNTVRSDIVAALDKGVFKGTVYETYHKGGNLLSASWESDAWAPEPPRFASHVAVGSPIGLDGQLDVDQDGLLQTLLTNEDLQGATLPSAYFQVLNAYVWNSSLIAP